MESTKREDYCTINSSEVPAYLLEIERETHLKTLNPRMLSGQLQGRFLSMISRLLTPKRILEIGTFTAYSTLCLAEGLQDNGRIDTIEVNRELEAMIKRNLSKSPYGDKIEVIFGDAKQILSSLDAGYDLVFMDAAKEEYIEYYEKILPLMKKGALLLADNVLWDGKVYSDPEDSTARSISRFNRFIHTDNRVENIILPLRDGLSMIQKR